MFEEAHGTKLSDKTDSPQHIKKLEILWKIKGASDILNIRRWLKFVVVGDKQAVVISKREINTIIMRIQRRSMLNSCSTEKGKW